MATSLRKDLANRWTKARIATATAILRAIPFDYAALLGTVGAVPGERRLIDLRGLPLKENIDGVQLHDVDMSYCDWKAQGKLTRVSARNCRFQHLRVDGVLAYEFRGCDFANSRFADPTGLSRCLFEDCNFGTCQFLRGSFDRSTFRRCSFEGASFRSTELERCRFEDCMFTDATFKKVSFGGAVFAGRRNTFLFRDFGDGSPQRREGYPSLPVVDLGDAHMCMAQFL